MTARQLFYAPEGTLRAPWRIVAFVVLSVVAVLVVQETIGPILEWVFTRGASRGVDVGSWTFAIALLVSTGIMVRHVDKRPWSEVWLDARAARPPLLALGFAIGAFAIGSPIALLIVAHWLRDVGAPAGSWLGSATRVTMTLAPAALAEELLTRGYVLSVLRDSWGWSAAIAVTSIAFGLLHVANPDVTGASIALVTLAGFFLAAVLYATRSLYAAWMAHLAWNWTMAVLFHTAVSGLPMESPGYRYVDAGPDWATGGRWGPEGGVPAALGMLASMAFLYAVRRTRTSSSSNTSRN